MTHPHTEFAWPGNGVHRVPYRVYTDPDIYAEEQQKIFRGETWNFLGMEQEVPEPGDFKTTFVGDTPVILLRDENGDIQAVVNRCAHRGNLVCYKNRGKLEDGRLTCVYHNWTYDLQGRLKSVAFGKGVGGRGGMPDDFDRAEHGLRRLRTETYCGLVFGTFSDTVAPFAEHIGADMRDNFQRVIGRKMKILATYSQYMPNNWKLYMENVKDSYHASILHLFQATFRLNKLSMEGGIKLSDSGWHHISYSIAATDKEEAEYSADKLRAVDDEFGLKDPSLLARWAEYPCGTTLAIQGMYPNFVLQQISNSIALRLCLPKGPEECELLWWVLGAEDDTPEQHEIRLKQANMIGPGGLISMEDGVVGGWVQRATGNDGDDLTLLEMGGRDVVPSKESRATEVSIRGFWKAYRELMGV
jgi:anthranilate 1,2-dioxygenase large subunit/terephthalate 1,2-dioxygenase oxygenase component alpha subunit